MCCWRSNLLSPRSELICWSLLQIGIGVGSINVLRTDLASPPSLIHSLAKPLFIIQFFSLNTLSSLNIECPLRQRREQHNDHSFKWTDTRAVNSQSDFSISDHIDQNRTTVNDVGYTDNVQLTTYMHHCGGASRNMQQLNECASGLDQGSSIRAEANILNDTTGSHNWDGAVTSIGQVDNTKYLTRNTTMHCSCNWYTHSALTSSLNQDLSHNDVQVEISVMEDSADTALSWRKNQDLVIIPNRYFEYAPRAPSYSARAYHPSKGNEPNNYPSSKPLSISENCPAAQARVVIVQDFTCSFRLVTFLYFLYHVFEIYERALQKFCVFADEKLPKLKNKKYADYKFESEEWKMLDLIQEVLAETMVALDKFSPVKDALEKGLEKLHKWYKSLDQSDTYFICLGASSSFCKNDAESYERGYVSLLKVFDSYYKHPENPTSSFTAGASNEEPKSEFKGYGSDWLLSSLKEAPEAANSATHNP
ncbi:uncharacterized protein LACBIDRAFT_326679 [Laccaria bicolor S238N-H82]|uniref:Predicted protein n=1 Tax=Laccaria bicolor (strain S238N-H82 / ATCC MYA-4686) TaxID=486041 RepID=B0D841_LACBS|nr:uncharacterized protein LACBIDRAFT_326679 [Laccaria bicolor S238N-H82]EDR09009.1 predicted protein [Laccaria bicolor S238N-H82]|eukprot:XP_001880322.1 predicted protein [Laccaria bicolor S238N-H82]